MPKSHLLKDQLISKESKHQRVESMYPFLALLLAVSIWGIALPVIKITTQYVPPFTFLLIRFVIVCALMLPFMIIELVRDPIDTRDLKNLILLGITGQSAIAFIFWGVKFSTALDTALISTIAPLMTIAAGHHFYNERVNSIVKFGILLATIGTFMVVIEPVFSHGISQTDAIKRLFGNLLVILYNISFTAYIVWSKTIMGQRSSVLDKTIKRLKINQMKKAYSPIVHTGFTFYVALATFIPLAVLEHFGVFGNYGFSFSNLTVVPVLGILYMALFSSIVAYIAYEWGLKEAQVTDGAIFGYLGPIFTLPAAYILLGEVPTKFILLASVIIGLGVYIAETNKN